MSHRVDRSMPCVVLALLAGLSLAPAAPAQTAVGDLTTLVVTDAGLFRVDVNQPAQQLAGPAAFGGAAELTAPAITWIAGTDAFIVTQGDSQGHGGMWRVDVQPAGAPLITDITPAPGLGFGKDYADSDYSVGLDALFVLEDTLGRVLVLSDPAHRTGDDFAVWADYTPTEGQSIAVNGAKAPFGVILSTRTGPILRITKEGETTVHDTGEVYAQVAANPMTGEWYAMHQGEDLIGILGGQFVMNMNVSGFCNKLVLKPVDIVWDPIARRLVAMGEDPVATCAFGGLVTGPNHVVRLPLTAGGGPPNNVPVLLSNLGPSDVQGVKGDIAHVRVGGSDVTYLGMPGTAGNGVSPVYANGGYQGAFALGKTTQVLLQEAPPSAPAFLVLGVAVWGVPFQGQHVLPLPQVLQPAPTNASGEAITNVDIPNLQGLLGVRVISQWWIDDTTTAAPGDYVSTRGVINTIGVK